MSFIVGCPWWQFTAFKEPLGGLLALNNWTRIKPLLMFSIRKRSNRRAEPPGILFILFCLVTNMKDSSEDSVPNKASCLSLLLLLWVRVTSSKKSFPLLRPSETVKILLPLYVLHSRLVERYLLTHNFFVVKRAERAVVSVSSPQTKKVWSLIQGVETFYVEFAPSFGVSIVHTTFRGSLTQSKNTYMRSLPVSKQSNYCKLVYICSSKTDDRLHSRTQ